MQAKVGTVLLWILNREGGSLPFQQGVPRLPGLLSLWMPASCTHSKKPRTVLDSGRRIRSFASIVTCLLCHGSKFRIICCKKEIFQHLWRVSCNPVFIWIFIRIQTPLRTNADPGQCRKQRRRFPLGNLKEYPGCQGLKQGPTGGFQLGGGGVKQKKRPKSTLWGLRVNYDISQSHFIDKNVEDK